MNREQKKARFNIVDAVIILIVLAILACATYLIASDLQARKNTRQMGNMTFTVRISEVNQEALSLFETGTVVKDSVTGAALGKIAAVTMENTKYYGSVASPDGGSYTLPVSAYSDKYDVYVIVSATASRDDRGIHYAGDTKVLVGSTVYFQIPSFTSVSYITDFTPMTAE